MLFELSELTVLNTVSFGEPLCAPEALHALAKSLGNTEAFSIYKAVERLFEHRV